MYNAVIGMSGQFQTQQPGQPIVKFRMHPVLNEQKSWGIKDNSGAVIKEGEGRPIYDEEEFVTITIPGDRNDIIDRPVTDMDRKRFEPLYKAWKSGSGESSSGTPLSAWPGISRSQVEELAFFSVRTVEELAEMADQHAQKFMGINQLRQRARDFLQAAKGNAHSEKLRAEVTEKDNRLATLETTVREQAKLIEELRKGKR